MNEIINTYIQNTFNPELEFEVRKTLSIFENFLLEGVDDDLSNLLMCIEDADRDQVQDNFIAILNKKIDFIFLSHSLRFSEKTPLHIKNDILNAIFILQDLNDYTLAVDTISSSTDTNFAIANVIALYCTVGVGNILNYLQSVDSSLLDKIENLYIEQRNSEIDPNTATIRENIEKIYDYVRAFDDMIKVECLGSMMVGKGYKAGYPIKQYLSLVRDDIVIITADGVDKGVSARDSIANNIISLVLLSENGYEQLEQIISDNVAQMVPNVTSPLLDAISSKITEFRKFYEERSHASNDIPQ